MKHAIDIVDRDIKVTIIWYFTASNGGIPAKIRPVIMPGNATIPNVLALSIVGCKPVFITSRMIALDACLGVLPKASLISTSC